MSHWLRFAVFSGAIGAAFALAGPAAADPAVAQVDSGDEFDDDLDDGDGAPAISTGAGPATAQFGVGFRLRNVIVPHGLIEMFVERASSGSSQAAFGVELIRRKGDFEMVFGLEYDRLSPDDGYWVDDDQEVDYVEFDGLGWIALDAAFVWHAPLHDKVAFRYGAGLGLGIVQGDVYRTDAVCSGPDYTNCSHAGAREREDDIPPVFPVVNLLAGVQVRPIDKLTINLEGGIRTFPYLGASVGYFF